MREVTIGDFLTDDQIDSAVMIYQKDRDNFHKRVVSEVLTPNMAEINRKLGQENDVDYIGYMLEHIFNQVKR